MATGSDRIELPENPTSDEEWKDRVRAENQALEEALKPKPAEPAAAPEPKATAAASKSDDARTSRRAPPRLPNADFVTLVSMLSSQAMVGLGVMPHPISQKPDPQPELARHFIDLLGVLEEKTKGNLTPDEHRLLESTLHDLRMAFIHQ